MGTKNRWISDAKYKRQDMSIPDSVTLWKEGRAQQAQDEWHSLPEVKYFKEQGLLPKGNFHVLETDNFEFSLAKKQADTIKELTSQMSQIEKIKSDVLKNIVHMQTGTDISSVDLLLKDNLSEITGAFNEFAITLPHRTPLVGIPSSLTSTIDYASMSSLPKSFLRNKYGKFSSAMAFLFHETDHATSMSEQYKKVQEEYNKRKMVVPTEASENSMSVTNPTTRGPLINDQYHYSTVRNSIRRKDVEIAGRRAFLSKDATNNLPGYREFGNDYVRRWRAERAKYKRDIDKAYLSSTKIYSETRAQFAERWFETTEFHDHGSLLTKESLKDVLSKEKALGIKTGEDSRKAYSAVMDKFYRRIPEEARADEFAIKALEPKRPLAKLAAEEKRLTTPLQEAQLATTEKVLGKDVVKNLNSRKSPLEIQKRLQILQVEPTYNKEDKSVVELVSKKSGRKLGLSELTNYTSKEDKSNIIYQSEIEINPRLQGARLREAGFKNPKIAMRMLKEQIKQSVKFINPDLRNFLTPMHLLGNEELFASINGRATTQGSMMGTSEAALHFWKSKHVEIFLRRAGFTKHIVEGVKDGEIVSSAAFEYPGYFKDASKRAKLKKTKDNIKSGRQSTGETNATVKRGISQIAKKERWINLEKDIKATPLSIAQEGLTKTVTGTAVEASSFTKATNALGRMGNKGRGQIRAILGILGIASLGLVTPNLTTPINNLAHGFFTANQISQVIKMSEVDAKTAIAKPFTVAYRDAKLKGQHIPSDLPDIYKVGGKGNLTAGQLSNNIYSGDYINLNSEVKPAKFVEHAGHEIKHLFQAAGVGGVKPFQSVYAESVEKAAGKTDREKYLNSIYEKEAYEFQHTFANEHVPSNVEKEAIDHLNKMTYGGRRAMAKINYADRLQKNPHQVAKLTTSNSATNLIKGSRSGAKKLGFKTLARTLKR